MKRKIYFNDKIFLIDLEELARKIKEVKKSRLKENGGVGSGIKGHRTYRAEE